MARRSSIVVVTALLLMPAFPALADSEFVASASVPGRSILAVAGKGFLVGGSDGTLPSEVSTYDPVDGTIAARGTLPYPVLDPALVFAHGLVHVFGGDYVQAFDPATTDAPYALTPALASPLTGPVAAVSLDDAGRFVLVGPGTPAATGRIEVRVIDDANPGGPATVLGTIPDTGTVPPLVATPSGIFLFVGADVFRIQPGTEPQLLLLTDNPDTPRPTIGGGAAVWNASHVVILDDSATLFLWKPPSPEWPAQRGAVRFDDSPTGAPRSAALFPDGIHFTALSGSSTDIYRWRLPALAPGFTGDCRGTLTCTLDGPAGSYPYGLTFQWRVRGVDRPPGPTTTVDLASVDDHPLVHVTATDPLGRTATLEEEFYPDLGPPNDFVEFACWGGNLTCLFDATQTIDPDGGRVETATLSTKGAVCEAIAGTLKRRCIFSEPGPRSVSFEFVDNLGLRSWWNATIDPSGAPGIVAEPPDCDGLHCLFVVHVWDDVAGTTLIDAGVGGSTSCGSFPSNSGSEGSMCLLFAKFPSNGTYEVVYTADAPDIDATARQTLAVVNLPPDLYSYVYCREGSLICTGSAGAFDPDDPAFSVPIEWEAEPGLVKPGADFVHSYSPGIHRIRTSATDALGWKVVEEHFVAVRPYEWRNFPELSRGATAPKLAGDGFALYALDAPTGSSLSTRLRTTQEGATVWKDVVGPAGMTDPAFISHGFELFVLGGSGPDGFPTSRLQVFDRGAGTWSEGPALPAALTGAGAVATFEGIWLLGGTSTSGPSNAAWRLEDGTWVPLPALPWSGTMRVAEVFGTVFAAGSIGGVWQIAQFERATGELPDRWTLVTLPPGGLGNLGGLASQGGRLWTYTAALPPILRAYDPFAALESAAWETAPPPPTTLAGITDFGGYVAGASPGAVGNIKILVQRLPPTPLSDIVATVRPIATSREPVTLLVKAEVTAGGAFDELVRIAIRREGAAPHAPAAWTRDVALSQAAPVSRSTTPPLAPGSYVAYFETVTGGGRFAHRFEVTSFWA